MTPTTYSLDTGLRMHHIDEESFHRVCKAIFEGDKLVTLVVSKIESMVCHPAGVDDESDEDETEPFLGGKVVSIGILGQGYR
jgi:hypothetical protein